MRTFAPRGLSHFLVLALLISGCAASHQPYAAQAPGAYDLKAESDGVQVAIDPFTEAERCDRHFGLDLLQDGVLPVFVAVENGGEASLVVQRRRITLAGEGYLDDTERQERADSSAAGVVGMGTNIAAVAGIFFPPALLLAIPGVVASMKMRSDHNNRLHELEKSSLLDSTLSPGESASGFVYFDLREIADGSDPITVVVQLTDLATHTQRDFRFTVALPERP